METYSTPDIIRILQKKQVSFFSLADFGRLFNIGNQQTLYKKIQRLEEKNIIAAIIFSGETFGTKDMRKRINGDSRVKQCDG